MKKKNEANIKLFYITCVLAALTVLVVLTKPTAYDKCFNQCMKTHVKLHPDSRESKQTWCFVQCSGYKQCRGGEYR